jgi:hypothetical protein
MAQGYLDYNPISSFPPLLGWQMCTITSIFFSLRWGFPNLFIQLAPNCNPPRFQFRKYLGLQAWATMPSYV